MSEWYYAKDGKQNGPVGFDQLVTLARSGGLDPVKDLVWNSTMKDWIPAGQVPDIFASPSAPPGPAADPNNPYAAPASTWNPVAQITAGEALEEIIPGSEPLDVMACVKRGFDLTVRNFGNILLVGVVYFAVLFGVGLVVGLIDVVLGHGHGSVTHFQSGATAGFSASQQNASPLANLINQLTSIFLSLGATRIGLNLVSGKEISVGMLFGGAGKFLPALGATILYMLMVAVGLIFLIAPGIYLAMRYGQYLTAMVDRDLGIMDSFNYSSSITTNNRMNLFLLALMAIVISLAGCLALCVGLFFAIPVIWLGWLVAYRWMQYGHRAALDHSGTTTPMLANV
ncbi:MAG: DUF4339 domain-containing protein [Luteolibacter sp.]